MRILCLTNMYPTPTEPWLGLFVAEQVEDLRRLGVDVSVHAFDGRPDWKEYFRTGRRLRRAVADGNFDLVQAHYGLTGAVALAQLHAETDKHDPAMPFSCIDARAEGSTEAADDLCAWRAVRPRS